MTQDEFNQLGKSIIKNNIYLTLATSNTNPWIAPLFYCADENFNFYFISQLDSTHSKHVRINPNVAFAIFDSHIEEGKGNGIQASGKAYLLSESLDIENALKYYHTNFVEITKESVSGSSSYKLFKIVPDHFFVLDSEAKVDKRVEVFLK